MILSFQFSLSEIIEFYCLAVVQLFSPLQPIQLSFVFPPDPPWKGEEGRQTLSHEVGAQVLTAMPVFPPQTGRFHQLLNKVGSLRVRESAEYLESRNILYISSLEGFLYWRLLIPFPHITFGE